MSNLERIEADLGRAREAIRKAVHEKNHTSNYKENDDVIIPKGSVYRNAQSFYQLSSKHNYLSMVNFDSVMLNFQFEFNYLFEV